MSPDDESGAAPGKLWVTCTFRLLEDEKALLELMSRELITTPSRLMRFACCSLLLRQRPQMKQILNDYLYGRNVSDE